LLELAISTDAEVIMSSPMQSKENATSSTVLSGRAGAAAKSLARDSRFVRSKLAI
jgi:hypothetical protein